jgi:hypothetical protein
MARLEFCKQCQQYVNNKFLLLLTREPLCLKALREFVNNVNNNFYNLVYFDKKKKGVYT